MKTQQTPSQTPSKPSKDVPCRTLPKVTPEVARSILRVDMPSVRDPAESEGSEPMFKPFGGLPFVDMERHVTNPLMPRLDAAKRAEDLMRALPVRKFALRRRLNQGPAREVPLPAFLPIPTEDPSESSDNENRNPVFTPVPAAKRRRLSCPPPPVFFRPIDRRALELQDPTNMPSGIMLPSI